MSKGNNFFQKMSINMKFAHVIIKVININIQTTLAKSRHDKKKTIEVYYSNFLKSNGYSFGQTRKLMQNLIIVGKY